MFVSKIDITMSCQNPLCVWKILSFSISYVHVKCTTLLFVFGLY